MRFAGGIAIEVTPVAEFPGNSVTDVIAIEVTSVAEFPGNSVTDVKQKEVTSVAEFPGNSGTYVKKSLIEHQKKKFDMISGQKKSLT